MSRLESKSIHVHWFLHQINPIYIFLLFKWRKTRIVSHRFDHLYVELWILCLPSLPLTIFSVCVFLPLREYAFWTAKCALIKIFANAINQPESIFHHQFGGIFCFRFKKEKFRSIDKNRERKNWKWKMETGGKRWDLIVTWFFFWEFGQCTEMNLIYEIPLLKWREIMVFSLRNHFWLLLMLLLQITTERKRSC